MRLVLATRCPGGARTGRLSRSAGSRTNPAAGLRGFAAVVDYPSDYLV